MSAKTLVVLVAVLLLSLFLMNACGGGGGGAPAPAGTTTYTVGGAVSGLTGTVVLQNNSGNDIRIISSGTFTFAGVLSNGMSYAVQVKTQPSGQTCTASNNIGTVANANVTDIAIACSSATYTVGGVVSGLTGTVKLLVNGTDDLPLGANGAFSFSQPLANGGGYLVTVAAQPFGQTCTASSNAGIVSGSTVTNIVVACSAATYKVGGSISGLVSGKKVTLKNNGVDDLLLASNGTFTFPSSLADGAGFAVTVRNQPVNQTCLVTQGAGTVSGADVNVVAVDCASNIAAPSALMVSSTTATHVVLNWTDSSDNEQGFRIERSTDNVDFTPLASLGANTQTYTDSATVADTYYYYRVKAYNADGDSLRSNTAETTTHTYSTVVGLIQNVAESLKGNEIVGSGTMNGGIYTAYWNLIGFAFCMPVDPYVAPAADSVSPVSVYGCTNAITTSITPSTSSVIITFATPTLYIDASVYTTGVPAISTTAAYVTYTNVVITMNAPLTITSDGRYDIGTVTSGNMAYSNSAITINNSMLNFFASTLMSIVQGTVDSTLLGKITDLTDSVVATMPPYVP